MNLHLSTPEESIVLAIEEIGHSVRNFTNVKFQQIKTQLSLFLVNIDFNESDRYIFLKIYLFVHTTYQTTNDKYHNFKIGKAKTTLFSKTFKKLC